MKFTAATVSAIALTSVGAFAPSTVYPRSETTLFSTEEKATTKKDDRLRFMKSKRFHRQGFKEVRADVENAIKDQFQSTLVDDLKTNNFVVEKDGVKVFLAKDFGFCWGVERSIALAYEAVQHYPGKKLHITNELIHNPEVNDRLTDLKVNLIEKVGDGKKKFEVVEDGDVVILPAFGASYEEMEFLDKKVGTWQHVGNGSVVPHSSVWNTVDRHQKKGLTSIIHGKYGHEETIATTSFCEDFICVKDMKEAEMVADYIANGGDKDQFLKHFEKAVSKGFDPDKMLDKVGLANQTTMYKKETKAIGQLFQKTMMKKFGPSKIDEHYFEFDTICDATQERQDAVTELTANAEEYGLDFILVVGGWDSSNTAHLLEIPHNSGVRSFHINRAECISADNTITHRTVDGDIVTEPFLLDMDKEVVMGVTSGASTPDAAVQDALSQIFLLRKMHGVEKVEA
eukprot:scaffold783_cov118-Cylindrotheca_fusiformis.AAC.9